MKFIYAGQKDSRFAFMESGSAAFFGAIEGGGIIRNPSGVFDSVDEKVGSIAGQVDKLLAARNSFIYSMLTARRAAV